MNGTTLKSGIWRRDEAAADERERDGILVRVLTLGYGAMSYAAFFVTFLYAIGFIGNLLVPKSLDSPATDAWPAALLIDVGLLSIFAVQHSVMARQWFKRLLTRIIPASAERSTYVLASSLALMLVFWQWRPLGGTVWNVEGQAGRAVLLGGFAFGWGLVLVSTLVINHFDLFGLRQTWRAFRGQPQAGLRFVTPILSRVVRHPLSVGWLFTFWSTPTMTVTPLLFAVVTGCILVAIQLEERDLMRRILNTWGASARDARAVSAPLAAVAEPTQTARV
jgi:protein-S-isoprenylcysteine O-methyltransferase Ste14